MWSVVVLGSAQDGGLPQFAARTALDAAARSGAIPRRLTSAVAIVGSDGRVFLLDAGPDLPRHEEALLEHPALQHRAEAFPWDGIAITHAHVGHYAGLLHLGREVSAAHRLPCWVTPTMAAFLRGNAPWSLAVDQGHIELRPVAPGEPFFPWEDLRIEFIPVPHRHEASDTVAVSVAEAVLYLPDIDSWETWEAAADVIAAHSIVFLDATFWAEGEVLGRDMSMIGHPLVPDTIARFGHLSEGRRLILTHLNHTNPLVDPAAQERQPVAEGGFEVAEEGMVIRF